MIGLADKIANALADGQPRIVPELARLLRVRDVAVRKILNEDTRFELCAPVEGRRPNARCWTLARMPGTGTGRDRDGMPPAQPAVEPQPLSRQCSGCQGDLDQITPGCDRCAVRHTMRRHRRHAKPQPIIRSSVGEARAMLDAAERYAWKYGWSGRLAVALATYTTLRRGPLAELRLGDFNPGAGTLRTPAGIVTIADDLADLIDAAIDAGVYKTSDDYLIPARAAVRRDGPRDPRTLWTLIREIALDAGIATSPERLRGALSDGPRSVGEAIREADRRRAA